MRLWVAVSHSLILGSPGFYIGEASHKDLRNICLNTETHLFFFYIVSFLELSSQLNSILLTFCKLDLFSVMVFKNALFSLFTYGFLTASEPCPPPPNYYFSWWKVSHFYQKEPKVSVSGGCTHVKASVFGTKYFPFVPDFQWKIFANVSVTLTLFSYQQRSASEKNVPFYRFFFLFYSFDVCILLPKNNGLTFTFIHLFMTLHFHGCTFADPTTSFAPSPSGWHLWEWMESLSGWKVPPQGEISCIRYIPYPKKNYVPHSWHSTNWQVQWLPFAPTISFVQPRFLFLQSSLYCDTATEQQIFEITTEIH